MQVAEVNSNVAQILDPDLVHLAKSIGKMTNFGRGAGLMFVQNADVKIWDQFLCKMTAPNPTTAGRQTAQKFSTFQKIFVQFAKSIGRLHKDESSFYANRTKTALSIGKITNFILHILFVLQFP